MSKMRLSARASVAALATAIGMAGAVTAAGELGLAVQADEDRDVIVVTAQRREQSALEVPISVTAISPDQLDAAGASQLTDIAELTPALRFDSAATFVQPTIRGVGTAVTNSGGGANVGIYVDGFYSPNPLAAEFDLMRLEGVQVLKGPQGTLFGRNTTGGAILLTTADPSPEPSTELSASYGSFNSFSAQGYTTFGVGGGFAMDLEGLFRSGDGFVDNITTGDDEVGAYENWSIRTGIKGNISDDVTLKLRYQHSETDDPTLMATNIYVGDDIGGAGTNFPAATYTNDPDEITTSGPVEFFSESDILQATLEFDLGFADLVSYSQYRSEDSLIVEDLDGTSVPVFLLHIDVENETISQEFLLTSKNEGKLEWTAGLFYFENEDTWRTLVGTPMPTDALASIPLGGSGTLTKSYAAFADFTYELNPQLFLTAGLRYSQDKIEDPYFIIPFSGMQTRVDPLDEDSLTPRVVLRYEPNSVSSVYASFTKGYKAPILDVGGNTGNVVDSEDISAYELGYKYASGPLRFDAAAYFYDYKDLQVSLYRGNPPSAQIVNAAESEIYGLEGQFSYDVADNFQVYGGGAYTHGRYTNFEEAPVFVRCTDPACASQGVAFLVVPTDLEDVDMQRTPEFTGNLGARYDTPAFGGNLAVSGNLYYTSSFFFGPSGTQFEQDGYEVLSLRADWTDQTERYRVSVYGDNLTDSRYRTQVLSNNFGISQAWSYPATVGVEVGVSF